MDEVYQDLNDFEKRLKKDDFFAAGAGGDSSDEDEYAQFGDKPRLSTEADVLREKNRILMEKLFKADKQINEYKEMVEAITAKAGEKGAGSQDLKDKKILDLAKKNRTLQLQIESLKTKAAKAAEIAIKMKKENDEITSQGGSGSPLQKKATPSDTMMSSMSGVETERKYKELEKKVTKMRNENQELKQSLDKAIKCLERETGEIVNLDDLLKDEQGWKGRAQKIEVLKSQVKKLKQELSGGLAGADGLSVISEQTGTNAVVGRMTHAEKNLSKLENNRAKELERTLQELAEAKEELGSLRTKYKAAVARRDTLEKEMKDIKQEVQSKMKILIEKTGKDYSLVNFFKENDDKLIHMLKTEIKRMEGAKGLKSQLSGGSQPLSQNSVAQDLSEFTKIKGENSRLKNQIKCLEIELEQKNEKVKHLLTSCVGAPDEALEEKELRIAELEDRCEQLEKENFHIKQEMTETAKHGFGRGATEQTPQLRSKDESDKIINELSKQNAILRRKLDDALEKLGKK